MSNELGSPEYARTLEQSANMRETVEKGICPFCKLDSKLNKLIREGVHWNMWHNPFPYPRHRNHIVIASKRHLTALDELVGEIWNELIALIRWAEKEYNLPGGAIVMRFGDPKYNAGTLRHFHVHIQVPDGSGPAMVVLAKISSFDSGSQNMEVLKAFLPPE